MSLPIKKIRDMEQAESNNLKLTKGRLFQKNKNSVATEIKVTLGTLSVSVNSKF